MTTPPKLLKQYDSNLVQMLLQAGLLAKPIKPIITYNFVSNL